MTITSTNFRLFSLSLIIFLSACTQQEQPIRIGTNVWPGYEPLYLARNLHYINDDEIILVEHQSASQVIRAYRNGNIDAAALTLDEVLLLAESGFEPQVILVFDISAGGDVIIAQHGITTMQQLKNKRVGVEGSALGAYVLNRALTINGMTPQDITIIQSEVSQHTNLFKQKKVDAVVTFEPVKSQLMALNGNSIFDSTQIPNEVVDVLVVEKSFLINNPNHIKQLTTAWFKSLELLKNQPIEAATIMSKRLKITPDEVISSFDGLHLPDRNENNELIGITQQATLIKTTEQLQNIMVNASLLKRKINVEKLFMGFEK